MSELVASSKTLSTQRAPDKDPKVVPYDLLDLILSYTIGQFLYETVDTIVPTGLHPNFLGALAGVSTTFRAIVLKLVAHAFRIPLPCENQSVLLAAYSEFRSLLLFKAATFGGALMDPVAAWQSPLMHAYGYYLRINLHGSILRSRKSEIYLALALCKGMNEGISQPLVDALHSQLEEVLAAEDSNHSLEKPWR